MVTCFIISFPCWEKDPSNLMFIIQICRCSDLQTAITFRGFDYKHVMIKLQFPIKIFQEQVIQTTQPNPALYWYSTTSHFCPLFKKKKIKQRAPISLASFERETCGFIFKCAKILGRLLNRSRKAGSKKDPSALSSGISLITLTHILRTYYEYERRSAFVSGQEFCCFTETSATFFR